MTTNKKFKLNDWVVSKDGKVGGLITFLDPKGRYALVKCNGVKSPVNVKLKDLESFG